MDHQQVALALRSVHVAAMATAFGGAVLVTWLAWRAPRERVLDVAIRYEQLFWLAAGVLVMTGVGNVGAYGPALPAPTSAWGRTFIAKLTLVAILVLLSLPRSLAVLRGGAPLRALYSATTVLLAIITGLAIGLAHG